MLGSGSFRKVLGVFAVCNPSKTPAKSQWEGKLIAGVVRNATFPNRVEVGVSAKEMRCAARTLQQWICDCSSGERLVCLQAVINVHSRRMKQYSPLQVQLTIITPSLPDRLGIL